MIEEPLSLNVFVCLRSLIDQKCCCTSRAKQSQLIDRWPIVFEDLIDLPRVFTYRVNSACFVQVNRLLLSKKYKKLSGELTFGRGETTLSWGETTLSWGEMT